MCGIVGSLVTQKSTFEIQHEFINTMRDAMTHRGPDGAGAWVSENKNIGLGHRRLAILDLSAAASQPMSSQNQNIKIVFNGEIYNHAEIRKELISLGRNKWLTSHSDTEVIVQAYEEWGIQCVGKFRGIFAIAIWDSRVNELILVRDRMGVKPIYYSEHNGRFNFASEIKALLKDPDQPKNVDEKALIDYLSFLVVPAPSTLFQGIKKLRCGTFIRISSIGIIEEKSYWNVLDNILPLDDLSENEISSMLMSKLSESVALRNISDVPVGVFLSGGIDSSTNLALLSGISREAIKSFSVGYADGYASYTNEIKFAEFAAEYFNSEFHKKLLTPEDLVQFIPQMIRLQDEPIADPVCFPLYYVAKLARDNGVKVAQIGEGADEIFFGYPGWRLFLILEAIDRLFGLRIIKVFCLNMLEFIGRKHKFYYEWLRRSLNGQPIFWGGAEGFTFTHKQDLLSKRMLEQYQSGESWSAIKPIYEMYLNKSKKISPLTWMTYLDINLRLPELLLMRVDKMTMGAGLEAREPFLDHKLVEFSFSIPDEIKTRRWRLKYILKIAIRGLIPDVIINRKKQGFGVPIQDWVFGGLREYIRGSILDFCSQTDFFNLSEINRLMEDRSASHQIWYLFNLSEWWREYIRE
jgi:asparagine synthase (glutamine-hydrolysing)